jgi:hypothetical protein
MVPVYHGCCGHNRQVHDKDGVYANNSAMNDLNLSESSGSIAHQTLAAPNCTAFVEYNPKSSLWTSCSPLGRTRFALRGDLRAWKLRLV